MDLAINPSIHQSRAEWLIDRLPVRCAVALHSMPLRQLEALLPNRKDLQPYFAPADATEHERQFQRVLALK